MSVISLSSSPPRLFARSPTPVVSSPSFASVTTSNGRDLNNVRDSFSTPSTIKREVLGINYGAENLPLCSPGRLKFKSSAGQEKANLGDRMEPVEQFDKLASAGMDPRSVVVPGVCSQDLDSRVIQITASDLRKSKKISKTSREDKPLNIPKATVRRKDWTPPKTVAEGNVHRASGTPAFGISLADSFGYATGDSANIKMAGNSSDSAITKRRKIHAVGTASGSGLERNSASTLPPVVGAKSKKKRGRSPAKKALTITARATSNYLGTGARDDNETPMMTFLTSTQARQEGAAYGVETVQTKIPRKTTKPKVAKQSRLKSPSTAIRSMQEQNIVFASASQLATVESPELLRDTIEAMKQSEALTNLAYIPSSQSGPITIASDTPEKTTIAKFRGKRNLWSAADRDGNNALLYNDDSIPPLALPLNLVQCDLNPTSNSQGNAKLCGSLLDDLFDDSLGKATNANNSAATYNVEDDNTPFSIRSGRLSIATNRGPSPLLIQQRAHSTSAMEHVPSSGLDRSRLSPPENDDGSPRFPSNGSYTKASADSVTHGNTDQPRAHRDVHKLPELPNYNVMPDIDLKGLLKEYGLKRLRKRENIIAKLEDCWRAKHGILGPDPKETARLQKLAEAKARAQKEEVKKREQQQSHVAFLSAVHDIAARPVTNTARRKISPKKTSKDNSSKASRANKIKTKKSKRVAHEEDVVNISDVEQDVTSGARDAFVTRVMNRSEAPIDESEVSDYESVMSSPTKGTGVRAAIKSSNGILVPLLPASKRGISQEPERCSSPGFEPVQIATAQKANPKPTGASSDLKQLIYPAILAPPSSTQPTPSPTWHEKILMYDPIVLEDFTVWLNTGGLNAIGEDGEIDILEVRSWLEGNGICCLWKGGWRGNKGKLKDGEHD